MKFFKDEHSNEWKIDLNVESIELVKSVLNIDLTTLFDGKLELLHRLTFQDHKTLAEVLWLLCGPSPSATRTSAEQMAVAGQKSSFFRALKGDALESAAKALVDEVIDFFPSRRRPALKLAVAKLWEVVDAGMSLAETKVKEIDTMSLISAISSQVASVSIPGLTPSASSV
jgi:hypothetical protein